MVVFYVTHWLSTIWNFSTKREKYLYYAIKHFSCFGVLAQFVSAITTTQLSLYVRIYTKFIVVICHRCRSSRNLINQQRYGGFVRGTPVKYIPQKMQYLCTMSLAMCAVSWNGQWGRNWCCFSYDQLMVLSARRYVVHSCHNLIYSGTQSITACHEFSTPTDADHISSASQ